jgi:SAM-dependent methyltransferase
VDPSGIESSISGDVVAESVATYSDDPDAFASYSACAVAGPFSAFAALLEPSSTVLDAGCGPGRDLARFAAQGHKPIGIDLNEDFVDRARAHGPVILGDLRSLPLQAASFDAVWASASLIHLPYEDAAVALQELARVARTGAPISVSVKTAGITGWADDVPRGRRWFSIWNPSAFAEAVEDAGMSVESIVGDDAWIQVTSRR